MKLPILCNLQIYWCSTVDNRLSDLFEALLFSYYYLCLFVFLVSCQSFIHLLVHDWPQLKPLYKRLRFRWMGTYIYSSYGCLRHASFVSSLCLFNVPFTNWEWPAPLYPHLSLPSTYKGQFAKEHFLSLFFFFSYACRIWKFLGQGLNLSHSCDLHSGGNGGSLTHFTIVGTSAFLLLIYSFFIYLLGMSPLSGVMYYEFFLPVCGLHFLSFSGDLGIAEVINFNVIRFINV